MNTDGNEKDLARKAMQEPGAWGAETDPHHARTPLQEKLLYGPYPSGNRHERRKAKKLMRLKG